MRRYSFTEVRVTDTEVYISDDCIPGTVSVTNMAEHVTKLVVKQHGDKRIIYRDSNGSWGELLHDHGNFTGFAEHKGLVN